ncbi:DUF3035 domain-containing protein [Amaricoccus solimangrovi]|nr:DUF3035 domain-containing protein [Amaricoccus solimangrovi]
MIVSAMALGACSRSTGDGELRSAGSPDEFMVLPTRPLEMPRNLASLPPPTPGAPNRVDIDPREEAVASLTGKDTAAAGTAGAAALIARAGPVDPNIRARLAQEDVVFREENRGKLLPRLFARDPNDVTYRAVTLDAPAEFERMRARGVGVPAAPPSALESD